MSKLGFWNSLTLIFGFISFHNIYLGFKCIYLSQSFDHRSRTPGGVDMNLRLARTSTLNVRTSLVRLFYCKSFPKHSYLKRTTQNEKRSSPLMLHSKEVATPKIAVCGAGVSGSVISNQLAKAGFDVQVFEAGRGPGGRSSTRVSRDPSGFSFDHGAQYMTPPKDPRAAALFEEWVQAGVVEEWTGRFGTLKVSEDECIFNEDTKMKKKYVGVPGMSAICTHLLNSTPGISAKFQMKVAKVLPKEGGGWQLMGLNSQDLGSYDFLVATDKLMADGVHPELILAGQPTGRRPELADAGLIGFQSLVESLPQSATSSVLMIAFDRRLDEIPFDGALVESPDKSSGLAWIARSSSKPGCNTQEGEAWVVQSNPEFSESLLSQLIAEKKDISRQEVYEKIQNSMYPMFEAAVGRYFAESKTKIPPPVILSGHRWGAAFPGDLGKEATFYADVEKRFIACGDFMTKAKIEGAIISAIDAAEHMKNMFPN